MYKKTTGLKGFDSQVVVRAGLTVFPVSRGSTMAKECLTATLGLFGMINGTDFVDF